MPGWEETVFFVGNIPFAAEEDSLRDVFVSAGHQVSTVKIARDADSHRSRGFGFVTVLTSDADALVKEMYGVECCGRNLRVAVSTSEQRSWPADAKSGLGRAPEEG